MSFFDRLKNYYLDVAKVLRDEASASSIFPNPVDKGATREKVYAEFLKQHAPSKCNVLFGGFVFDDNGNESKQLDIIITTDTTPQYNLGNKDGDGKSFSPIEGTLGVVSIKSKLDKKEIGDCLQGMASIPPMSKLDGRVNILVKITGYKNWPLKVVYAYDGLSPETIISHINDFYSRHSSIPIERRPDFIHVAGKFLVIKGNPRISISNNNIKDVKDIQAGKYETVTESCDLLGILLTLDDLQMKASASSHIHFSYGEVVNRIMRVV